MTRQQRVSLLGVAALIALVAFILLRGAGSDDTNATVAPAGPEATASAPAPAATKSTARRAPPPRRAARPPAPLLVAGSVAEIRVRKGETVRLRARSEAAEELHVHGYDEFAELPAGGRVVAMQFRADAEGIFEIEFEHSRTLVAELEVRP